MVGAGLLLLTACRGEGGLPREVTELPAPRLFDAAETMNQVRDLAIGEHGDVWTVSATPPFVHHFDSAGRLSASFGTAGSGPGELRVAYDVVAPTTVDPVMRIWDPVAQRILGYREDGTLAGATGTVERTPLRVPVVAEQMSYVRLIPFERWGRGYLLQDIPPREVKGFEGTSSVAHANLLVLDSAGAIVDTLVGFATFAGASRPADGILDLAPVPLWAACPDGSLAIVDPYGQRILMYDASGALARTDTLPLRGRPITDADIALWVRHAANLEELPGGAKLSTAQLDEIVNAFLTRRRGEVSAVSPPAVRVACAEDALWFQRYEAADNVRGLGREWLRRTRDGRWQRFRFPARFQPLAIRAGIAYGVHADSLDVERIGTVRIPE